MGKKEEDFRYQAEESRKKQERIEEMIREREANMREIKERDRTIGDKEGKIYELKKQNQELEKFKFVLDYKIKELKAQIDPKNDDIALMKRIIQGMDADLEEYHKKNKSLLGDISGLNGKQSTLQTEILLQRKKMAKAQTLAKHVKHDLHSVMDKIRDQKEMRAQFAKVHKKYVAMANANTAANLAAAAKTGGGSSPSAAGKGKSNPASPGAARAVQNGSKESTVSKDQISGASGGASGTAGGSAATVQEMDEDELAQEEIQVEYNRQQEYLAQSVDALKAKLEKDSEIHRQDNARAMQENMALIRNCDQIRKEIAEMKHERAQKKLAS